MELSRRDLFLSCYPFPYLHYQFTTQQAKLASAKIPISNLQQVGINTYLYRFHIRIMIEDFGHRVYDKDGQVMRHIIWVR